MASPERALPHLATTGIGSLPHTQLELALQQAFAVDIPFLPQLPSANPAELMLPQALEGLPGLRYDEQGECTVDMAEWQRGARSLNARLDRALEGKELSYFEPTALSCRAWRPFLWDVEEKKKPWAKAQITGPMTLRLVLRTADGRSLGAVPELEEQVLRLTLARAVAMARALAETGASPLVFLDEPGLYAFDKRNPQHLVALQGLRIVILALRKEGARVGVHCCSNTDWASVLGLGFDLVSLDARLSLGSLLSQGPAVEKFLSGGGRLALGVIPTNLEAVYRVGDLLAALAETVQAHLGSAELRQKVLRESLLSPACGLALRSVSDAERVFGELAEAQRVLRITAG
jgi:methionine synthase II (cobalamin-independent)